MWTVLRLSLCNAPSSICQGILAIAVAYCDSLVMCTQGDQGGAGVPGDIGFQGDKVITFLCSIILTPYIAVCVATSFSAHLKPPGAGTCCQVVLLLDMLSLCESHAS